ncbi:MAG: CsbD family protein [Thermomicrobiales bacterium]
MTDGKQDKAEGFADKIAGKVKEAVGKVTDDEKTEAEGRGQQTEGEVHAGVGKAKDVAGDIQDKFKKN